MFRHWNLPGLIGHRRAPWILGFALSGLAAIQALHRARQGRGAFLRWEPEFAAFWSGGELYGIGVEGYPTLPITLLLMSPFRALGPVPGACAWALFKIGLAWWILTRAFSLAQDDDRRLLPSAQVAVLLLSFRPMLSDITHGNLNLLVGAVIVSAAWTWQRGRSLQSGFWLGFGAVLKVTPALGGLYYLYKRDGRALVGMSLGAALGLCLPAVFIGWDQTLHHTRGWWNQMIAPYLAANPLGLQQTEHINQSLLGVLARWTTDSVAIPSNGERVHEDVGIQIMALGRDSFRLLHLFACTAVLGFLGGCLARPSTRRASLTTLGEWSMLALAMLFLSERSWKHHYVLLALPITFLIAQLSYAAGDWRRRLALIGLVTSALMIGGTGSGVLGSHGSNLAEAYGSFLAAGLALFVSVGLVLRRRRDQEESNPSRMASRASSAVE